MIAYAEPDSTNDKNVKVNYRHQNSNYQLHILGTVEDGMAIAAKLMQFDDSTTSIQDIQKWIKDQDFPGNDDVKSPA